MKTIDRRKIMSDPVHHMDEAVNEEKAPLVDSSQLGANSESETMEAGTQQANEKNKQSHQDKAAEANDLAESLMQAEAKAAEHYDAMLRAIAEAENARRRTQEEVAKAHKYAIEKFVEHLLPVMDSMYAALADASADATKVREGVELTMKQLSVAFEKGRIVELNPLGEKFDPHCHQAISMVPADQEPNTVVTVLQRGYQLADRVLRPALVTVAQSK